MGSECLIGTRFPFGLMKLMELDSDGGYITL